MRRAESDVGVGCVVVLDLLPFVVGFVECFHDPYFSGLSCCLIDRSMSLMNAARAANLDPLLIKYEVCSDCKIVVHSARVSVTLGLVSVSGST